jgi:indole-3-acetate monooxygenase
MKAVLEAVRAAGAQAEQCRRLPDTVLSLLREEGLLRLAVPAALGGDPCPLPELLRYLMLLAAADSSTAWLVMVWTQAQIIAARLGEERYRLLLAESPDVILAATSAGNGTATPVHDGLEVTGHWRFTSGSSHATGILVHCQPAPGPGGQIGVLLPARSVAIDDTWRTLGLRATASNGVHADRVRVGGADAYELDATACPSATEHSRLPIRPSFALHMGAIAVGNAWAALHGDSAPDDLAIHKSSAAEAPLLSTQRLWQALQECARQAWDRVIDGGSVDDDLSRRMAELGARAVQASTDVTVGRYRNEGSSVIYDRDPLQRRLRDALTMSQHANVSHRRLARDGAPPTATSRAGASR